MGKGSIERRPIFSLEIFKGEILDAAGAGDYFETDQAVTDTPTLYMTLSAALTRIYVDRVHVNLTPTNAVTYNFYLFTDAQADNVTSEGLKIFDSTDFYPAGMASGMEYEFMDMATPAVLTTAGRIYYLIDWSGAPGNTPGYLKVFGSGG